MSRIDEALRRARGEQPEHRATDFEADAPWEFAEGTSARARSGRPDARPETPNALIPEESGVPDEVTLPPASSATGAIPEGGLFVSLDGDERMVGAGLRQAVVEEYRKLASSLHQAQINHRLQVVLVASAVPGEGKSLTAANVALTLTTSYSRKVLLIDADLRRPSLHGLFRAPETSGLSEGLDAATASRVSAIQLSPLLALLPAGRPVENPVPLLTSERMGELVRDARQHFDWIVIDTPPVALLTDANLLTKECDGALLVIHANRTPYALVQKAVQALGKPKIFGVVLNRLEDHITVHSGYGKYGGYYNDYGRGGQ
ncbi:Tyrosine-protein kinase YwqD [Luteitalea pratensis]|uniref:Tyrosine-protein kinase YwqD n=1 Tax=Luteitalea pratensis TaxID=1855912 RepID=A0A143PNR5_LUTPR|nr:CpsD/CapB family tyrosine-protein kinase [Luteitalea pratensis]AMY10091.1 Tyrosine-protein kinase YwqD [Luteitalea pratensis]